MKILFLSSLLLLFFLNSHSQPVASTPNVFVITIDGFRWQELFEGADSSILNNPAYTDDTATMKTLYWAALAEDRRRLLMPFFWNFLAKKGQLYGNRNFQNDVNVANLYSFSYPGYNEILTGNTDALVASNRKRYNRNRNVLEYLNTRPGLEGKIAAFTSWDVFPYILNGKRNDLFINSGYQDLITDTSTEEQAMVNRVQEEGVAEKGRTRFDQLTFLTAKEYILQKHPRVLFLGLGETDEFAHHRRYDLYLEQIHKIDQMIAELWHLVQTLPGYKDNTVFLITTDHGRGSSADRWFSHSTFIKGSSQTWLALLGQGIEPLGEVRERQQRYQQELAQTIALLMGEEFTPGKAIIPALSLR